MAATEKPNFTQIANAFLEANYTVAGSLTLRRFEENWWHWRSYVYMPLQEAILRSQIYSDPIIQEHKPDKRFIDYVMDALKSICQVRSSTMPCWLNNRIIPYPKDVISFRNGWLSLSDLRSQHPELKPPTPDWFSSNICDYNYDPAARCPIWLQCLEDWFPGDTDSKNLLQEWFGYVLTSDTSLHRFMFMIGPPRTGKSTVMRVLKELLGGEKRIAATDILGLSDQFGLQPLVGKNLVQMAEFRLSNTKDHSIGLQRMISIVGEDPLYVRRKYIDDLASYTFCCKFMIAGNMIPRLSDASGALLERMLVLDFENAKPIIDKPDTNLFTKLQSEGSGILNWSIQGLKRLHDQGKFTIPSISQQRKHQFETELNPLSSFVQECVLLSPSSYLTRDQLYNAYIEWHDRFAKNRPPFTLPIFTKYITGASSGRIRYRRPAGDSPEYVFSGCALRPSKKPSSPPRLGAL